MEIKRCEAEGEPTGFRYRLPSDDEWYYLASQNKSTKINKKSDVVSPSDKNGSKTLGVRHLADNISEWTASDACQATKEQNHCNLKIVKGGSWKTNQSICEQIILDENSRENYIGFRIVRTNLPL
ncbi:hypothetical protein DMA11_21070 [Marinilabiliaceae bacterium JC017]|nr:hypothetical protein DMA11_21070 [Marinilabiliaceae bacterium JC017]